MTSSRPRLRRPSPALIVSCLALFAALGGGAYAASSLGSNLIFHPITPSGAWSNIGGSSAPLGGVLDSNGVVHLRGAISGGTSNTVAFTLATSLRPSHTLYLTAARSNGGSAVLEITSNGQAKPIGTGVGTYTGLDGISFAAGE